MRFESKRDAWLYAFMIGVPLVMFVVLKAPPFAYVVLVVVEGVIIPTTLRSTYYVIETDTLVIRSSGLTWRVPIRAITQITPTRSVASSPALSLDRLRIDYGGKSILVSPENANAFVDALRAINPAIMRRA